MTAPVDAAAPHSHVTTVQLRYAIYETVDDPATQSVGVLVPLTVTCDGLAWVVQSRDGVTGRGPTRAAALLAWLGARLGAMPSRVTVSPPSPVRSPCD